MKAIEENAFDYSRDGLGQTVEKFVNAMAESRATTLLVDEETGIQDELFSNLWAVQDAYVELFRDLLECGVMGKELALRSARAKAIEGSAK